jgi:hypothetical protein
MRKLLSSLVFLFLLVTNGQAQIITTVAGTGTPGFSGDGGAAIAAQLDHPAAVFADSAGNLFICDLGNQRIRMVSTSGSITTIAGVGSGSSYSGDGAPATAATIISPMGILKNESGIVFCNAGAADRVSKIDVAGIIKTIIGTGSYGYSGDGGPATAAQCAPRDIATDRYGNIYVADYTNHIRKVSVGGIITTIAGTGTTTGFSGDGGPATNAQMGFPSGVTTDRAGNIYFADLTNYRVRKVSAAGIITTIAGNGSSGYSGDGGPATAATITRTGGLVADGLGNLYLADNLNHAVRKIAASGIITTIAGNGSPGYSGDGGSATAATLFEPNYVSLHPNGDIYIADRNNDVIRKISYGNHIPVFTGGHIQSLSVCENSSLTLNSALTVSDADAGQTLSWTLITPPLHGAAPISYIATATGVTVIPAGLSYTPAAAYTGTDTFEVRIDDGRSVAFVTFYVNVIPVNLCEMEAGAFNSGSYSVYPNPGRGQFSLSLPEGVVGVMTITDVAGRVVMQRSVQNGAAIAIEESGVYMIAITTEAGVWRGKVVVVE